MWPTRQNGGSPYMWPTHHNGQLSHLSQEELNPLAMNRMALPLNLTYSSEWLWISALISDMEGTNPLTMTEWLSPYIWPWKEPILSPCQNGYGSHHFLWEEASIWRTPSLSLKYSNFNLANGFVSYLFLRRNIQELHCSSLHHIPNIVIFDLDMLRPIMEHKILWQLHATLVVTMYTSSI